MTCIKYEGIDGWNRPVFKDVNSKSRFGSTDILFSAGATEAQVKEKVSERDLVYFGNSFGSEPQGDKAKDLYIEWNTPVVLKKLDQGMGY